MSKCQIWYRLVLGYKQKLTEISAFLFTNSANSVRVSKLFEVALFVVAFILRCLSLVFGKGELMIGVFQQQKEA